MAKPDTLGALLAGGYGIVVRCHRCQRQFDVHLSELIQKRGASRRIAGMEPISCPECHGDRTELLIRPAKGPPTR